MGLVSAPTAVGCMAAALQQAGVFTQPRCEPAGGSGCTAAMSKVASQLVTASTLTGPPGTTNLAGRAAALSRKKGTRFCSTITSSRGSAYVRTEAAG